MIRFSELPEGKTPVRQGYELLRALPRGWPVWREGDQCFAIGYSNRFGGEYTRDSFVFKERITEDDYRAAYA